MGGIKKTSILFYRNLRHVTNFDSQIPDPSDIPHRLGEFFHPQNTREGQRFSLGKRVSMSV